ncbi:MAG: DUF1285 domain-containing protein [Paracoccus sp. (in: a-proteobacteria)]
MTSDTTAPAADRAGGITAVARRQGLHGPAPVHLWNPPYCGEMDMMIRADGTWLHEGSPIRRPEMVRMFANILKFEDGRYFLVTPVEKVGIQVEDAPFLAVNMEIWNDVIVFETNLGESVPLDQAHPLILSGTRDAPRPYIEVRSGLLARIDRKSYYRLAETIVQGPDGRLGVVSAGVYFPLEL